MSHKDHPAFRYKDASNQHILSDMISEAEELVRLTNTELEQLDIDLRFLLLMLENHE